MMKLAAKWETPQPFGAAAAAQATLFNKHVGSTSWWNELSVKGGLADVDKFLRAWKSQSLQFKKASSKFFLYD